MAEYFSRNFIEKGRASIQERLKGQAYRSLTRGGFDRGAGIILIQNYTAAIAVNFTDWMGKTLPWVRHEWARMVVIDNLRCETVDDHASMLEDFARHCGALPGSQSYTKVRKEIRNIRGLFHTPYWAGLSGLALMALLENISKDFIPVLREVADKLDCPPEHQTYLDVHGEADVVHSEQFLKALEAEASMGYGDNHLVASIFRAVESSVDSLSEAIFGKTIGT